MTMLIGTARTKILCATAVAVALALSPNARGGEITVGEGSLKVSGLLQFWVQDDFSKGVAATPRARRAEFRSTGALDQTVSWFLMVDAAQVKEDDVKVASVLTSPAGSKTSALTSAGRKSVLQDLGIIYAPTRWPWDLQFQVGQFKVPFGMEGLQGSSRLDAIERALMFSVLKWGDVRDLGGMASADAGLLRIQAGVFSGEGQNRGDVTQNKNVNVRAVARVLPWLTMGAAYQGGRSGIDDALNEHEGAELSLFFDQLHVPMWLKGEFAQGVTGLIGKATAIRTGYATLLAKPTTWLEVVARLDWLDPNVHRANDWRIQVTGGLNWHLGGSLDKRIQLNYVRNDEPTPKVQDDLLRANFQVSF